MAVFVLVVYYLLPFWLMSKDVFGGTFAHAQAGVCVACVHAH